MHLEIIYFVVVFTEEKNASHYFLKNEKAMVVILGGFVHHNV